MSLIQSITLMVGSVTAAIAAAKVFLRFHRAPQ